MEIVCWVNQWDAEYLKLPTDPPHKTLKFSNVMQYFSQHTYTFHDIVCTHYLLQAHLSKGSVA